MPWSTLPMDSQEQETYYLSIKIKNITTCLYYLD